MHTVNRMYLLYVRFAGHSLSNITVNRSTVQKSALMKTEGDTISIDIIIARTNKKSMIAFMVESIHWKKLAERQGSMLCYLCGKVCNPYGPPSDRPTVDHVIPISLGGTHTWDNVRLACMQCNSGKGMKVRKLKVLGG